MYVAVIPNRGSPPAILLRESYREDGKTKNRTLKNLSDWPAEQIEQLRAVLRGEHVTMGQSTDDLNGVGGGKQFLAAQHGAQLLDPLGRPVG